MSGKWKEVKKKKKKPSRRQQQQNKSKISFSKKTKYVYNTSSSPQQEPQKPTVVRTVPVGMSGSKKLMEKHKNKKIYSAANKKKKVKKYTNEDKGWDNSNSSWFDPNNYTSQTGEKDYFYNESVDKRELIQQNLCDKIRKNREKLGYSRADFAEAINESRDVVMKYESGGIVPKIHILKKMSKVLGVSLGKKAGKKVRDEKKNRFYDRSY